MHFWVFFKLKPSLKLRRCTKNFMSVISIIAGKAVSKATKLKGTGGSALPGYVVEKMEPNFIKNVLSKLPYGVIAISGTNGKTTTTKIVTEILEKQGLRVFTNKSGSNFIRGVISAILESISITGKFDYDIAVLELDEAHAVKFCEVVPVDYAMFMNVQRDQLDRFGETDFTASLLEKVAGYVKNTAVLNREDPRISKFKANKVEYFGLSDKMLEKFPKDECILSKEEVEKAGNKARVTLKDLDGQHATYEYKGQEYSCELSLKGNFNAYNAAGALTMCSLVLPNADMGKMVDALAGVESAFGRGEVFKYKGVELEMLLVKNPSAFQFSLASFADSKHDYMIAVNDHINDGCDLSWLWSVDFSALPEISVISGIRAYDMALRLKYDGIGCKTIEEDVQKALDIFVSTNDKPKRLFVTYSNMLALRKIISGKSMV